MTKSSPELKGILALLDTVGTTLKTPPFQRSFAWQTPQVDDFWNDLIRAIDAPKGSDDYFLGLVVVDDTDHIQDGQQRLASTLLLAACLYEQLKAAESIGSHDKAVVIDAQAYLAPALRTSPKASLALNPSDQDALLGRIGIRGDLPESARRLDAARKRLDRKLSEDLLPRTSPDAKLARIKQWAEYLYQQAHTVVLRVPAKDAHNIFETLNTRGVRLTNADLVKSHLIARASHVSLAVTKWMSLTESLKNADGNYESDLESFLLHYHGSRYGRTTKTSFFAAYREAVDKTDALGALDELIAAAGVYRALVDPVNSAPFWAKIGGGAQGVAELLNGLGLKQLRYLLLAVLQDLGKKLQGPARLKRQREAVEKIGAWSVRALVFGRTGGGEAERTYIAAASGIRQGTIITVDQLKQHFVDRGMLVLDDSLFRKRFVEFHFDGRYSHTRARAILYALERGKIAGQAALAPKSSLTLEHVLPQSPVEGTWSSFSADERADYTYRLGNLLLIDGPSGANNDLGPLEWPAKRSLIQSWGDQTPLTAEALKVQTWDRARIEKRTSALASLATLTWKP